LALILRNDILLLHIPKTGGNWITKMLRENRLIVGRIGHKHSTYDHLCGGGRSGPAGGVRNLLRGSYRISARPTIVCVVRHPLGWYESWFKYQQGKGRRDWGRNGDLRDWHVNSDLNGAPLDEFNAFMAYVNDRLPGYVGQLYGKYAANSGARILRNETLAPDVVRFCEDMGLAVDREKILSAPRHGVSPEMTLDWDPAILARTLALEAATLHRYGYEAGVEAAQA
jgi:hypothetical protein